MPCARHTAASWWPSSAIGSSPTGRASGAKSRNFQPASTSGQLRSPTKTFARRNLSCASYAASFATCGYAGDAPASFSPLAEETGLILPIGEWVLHQALSQAREWQDRGMRLRMAVNVSAMQIYRGDFTQVLAQALRDTGADPSTIEIELTESTVMADTETIREIFDCIRLLGVSVAIDDFGTGYSSLAYLRRFHVSKLKIDGSFVRDIPHDEESCAITEAIIRMAHSLRLGVIAEGVETAEQLQFLSDVGCGEIQGYLLSRPVTPREVEAAMALALRH